MSGTNGAQSVPPGFVQYHFRHAIGGFFEFPTANARRILPPHLQPVEPHHGQSVLSVMAFDFHKSMVGEYGELILSVLVDAAHRAGRAASPLRVLSVPPRHDDAGESREHAIERWHLPHFMENIDLSFDAQDDGHPDRGGARAARRSSTCGSPTTSGRRSRTATSAFMHDADGSYMSTIIMDADFSENEEERGEITIHTHPFTAAIDRDGVNTTPFRELWMRDGLQTFHPLETLAAAAV